jgi:membrane protein DedA with SNARE-associated domain
LLEAIASTLAAFGGPASEQVLRDYGPVGVFILLVLTGIGVPLGEDLITIPAGILIGHGVLHWPTTTAAAYAGVLTSDFLWYGLCRHFGTPLLHKRWFKRLAHPRRLLEVKHRIERRGAWVIVMARFVPGSRTPAITAAGMLSFSFWKFALAEVVASLAAVPLQLLLGYGIAKGVGTRHTADVVLAIVGVIVGMFALLLISAWWGRHRSGRAPRARAAWLRRFRGPARRARPS